MKPYSRSLNLTTAQEVFNYTLSRARMVVECAFGLLANRFRIFHRPIEVSTNTIDKIVMTSCVLHSFLITQRLRSSNELNDLNEDVLGDDGNNSDIFSPIGPQLMDNYRNSAKIRDNLADYYMTHGNVDFQWKKN